MNAPPSKLLDPCWGRRQTEQRAWTTIMRCRTELKLDDVPLPIPVEDWIEGPLGIQLGYTDLSYLGDQVLGAAFCEEREILVDEQVLKHEERCRFTCAHELGHVVMHGRVRKQFHDTKADVTLSSDKYERQADRFAAALLMPLPHLEQAIVRSFDERQLKRATCMHELMHVTAESEWLWRYRVLPAITREFFMSLSAAVFRCAEVQPRIRHTKPLMPRRLIQRLLQPAEADDTVTAVQVVDGRPQYRGLFHATTHADLPSDGEMFVVTAALLLYHDASYGSLSRHPLMFDEADLASVAECIEYRLRAFISDIGEGSQLRERLGDFVGTVIGCSAPVARGASSHST